MKILKIEQIKPDFSNDIFKNYASLINSRMPEHLPHLISIELNDNIKIASCIRRILLDELPAFAFNASFDQVKTDDRYILNDVVADRINLIPIVQESIKKGSENMISSIQFVNTTKNTKVLYAKDINSPFDFNKTHRITYVEHGKMIEVNGIKIERGTGRDHAKFSLVSNPTIRMLDYVSGEILDSRLKFIAAIFKTDDLIKLTKKKKEQFIDKKIIIVPNKNYYDNLSVRDVKHIKQFDIIIDGLNEKEEKDLLLVKNYQSTEFVSKSVLINIRTLGTIQPKNLMIKCFNNIIERLEKIKKMINDKTIIFFEEYQKKYTLSQESHSIAELLNYTIFELKPDIKFCGVDSGHPMEYKINLKIDTQDAENLLLKSIDINIKKFAEYIKLFSS
jgi:DNA-directed RNA polymerase alpha subunit